MADGLKMLSGSQGRVPVLLLLILASSQVGSSSPHGYSFGLPLLEAKYSHSASLGSLAFICVQKALAWYQLMQFMG